jgi:hypothetical protein
VHLFVRLHVHAAMLRSSNRSKPDSPHLPAACRWFGSGLGGSPSFLLLLARMKPTSSSLLPSWVGLVPPTLSYRAPHHRKKMPRTPSCSTEKGRIPHTRSFSQPPSSSRPHLPTTLNTCFRAAQTRGYAQFNALIPLFVRSADRRQMDAAAMSTKERPMRGKDSVRRRFLQPSVRPSGRGEGYLHPTPQSRRAPPPLERRIALRDPTAGSTPPQYHTHTHPNTTRAMDVSVSPFPPTPPTRPPLPRPRG